MGKFLLDKDEDTDFNDYELSFNEKILKVNLIIKYDYYNSYGAVVGALPANEEDSNSKIIDIKEGDKLMPLYPIRGDVDFNKSNEADIYDGKYIKGQSVNLEDGYLDLTMRSFSDDIKMVYGYIIVNNKQEYYETNFIE